MATDLFNNPSNDYVNPGLSPCAGAGDDAYFGIGDGAAEITSGSDILAKMDLSGIQIPVSAYSIQNQILSEGEVAYIPGLTKGLQKKVQGFKMPTLVSNNSTLNPYFFTIDLSLHYYKNFKYVDVAIDTSSNYGQNLNIEDALNIALNGINITASYDPSSLKFTGTVDGFEFNVSNVVLGIIDVSENSDSPFDKDANAEEYTLEEDSSLFVPYAKYPNGASQGIIMKGIYPTTTPQTPYDKWLYINHVTDFVTIYEPVEVDNFIENIQESVAITFDPSITFGPFINDVSIFVPELICSSTVYTYEPSYGFPIYNSIVDNSTLLYASYSFSRITNSVIEYSGISDFRVDDPSSWYIADSSVYGSELYDNNVGAITPESYIVNSFITDSSLTQVDVSGGFIQKSYVRLSLLEDSSAVCLYYFSNSTVEDSDLYNINGDDIGITGSNIGLSIFVDSSIWSSNIQDSSLVNSYVSDSEILDSDVSLGELEGTVAQNTYFSQSIISDSSIIGMAIDSSSLVTGSTLQGLYTNAYRLVTGDPSMPYIWVIDDPTLTIDDASSRVTIQTSDILDCSINNADIIDSSIYTSYLQDVSLSGCTLYNVEVDSSTTTLNDCKIVYINSSVDCSISYDVDSSIFYTRSVKTIDVGMSGCSTSSTMSAGDYLDWVNTNDYWNKFGDLYMWTSAPDGCSACHNLIDGFYVFNPHPFDIKIEYMLFI